MAKKRKRKKATRKRRSAKGSAFNRKHPRTKSGKFKKKRGTSKRKRRSTAKRRRRKGSSVRTARRRIMLRPGPGRRAVKYKLKRKTRRSSRGKRYYRYHISKNPLNAIKGALKEGLAFYTGLLGARVINNVLKLYVTDKYVAPKVTDTAGAMYKYVLPILPHLIGFGLTTVVLPKVMKGKQALVGKFQLGATIALFDAVFNTVVAPNLGDAKKYFSGYGAYNVHVPLAEYLNYDNRLGGGMSEYLDHDNRYGGLGMEVHEALAADEAHFMQSGGAGGVFAKTVFGAG